MILLLNKSRTASDLPARQAAKKQNSGSNFWSQFPTTLQVRKPIARQHQPGFVTMTDDENGADTTVFLERIGEVLLEFPLG